jgi:hypothetical protein
LLIYWNSNKHKISILQTCTIKPGKSARFYQLGQVVI